MARTFKRPRSSHPIAELNVTNMVDLGFTLLIIFMIATPLINQEQSIPINLPVESKKDQIKPDKDTKFITVAIDNKGAYSLDGNAITLTRLSERLKEFGEQPQPKQPVVRIRGDAKVVYEKIINLMDELHKNHLSRISFDTQAKD
jgi:biopolymer transport protein ExbD